MTVAGLDAGEVAFVVLAFLIAGSVKGTVGIGLPTASLGLMAQVMDPRAALALVLFPSLMANVWQVGRTGGAVETARRYAPFLLCLASVIALVSALVTGAVPTATLMVLLGLVMVLFSVTSLAFRPPRLPARLDRAGQVVAGTLSGLLGGLTTIWAPPMVIYLTARDVTGEAFVRATGVMILVGTGPLIWGFWQAGLLDAERAALSLAMTAPAIAGFGLGERLRRRLDAERFRRAVLVVFLLMGLNLIKRALL